MAAQRAYRAKRAALRDVDPLLWIRKKWNGMSGARRSRGHEVTITFDDIEWPTHCPILGVKLDYSGRDSHTSWSLDRSNNALGYVPGNVTVISLRANRLKSYGTENDHWRIAAWIDNPSAL